ncbi:MAG TPA: riboflavin synthase [Saprospiraceae bacterium]|nr:riboflavin synthase [Saprospiraceae bacterium]
MFSGIIQHLGRIESISLHGTTKRFEIASPMASHLRVDQSLCHDGVCLTVVENSESLHAVDVVQETLSKTTFDTLDIGHHVNLEKSISLNTLLDGHLVQGHVDTTLECLDKKDLHGSWHFTFRLRDQFTSLVIPHGSICLNGVSLTIARLTTDLVEVAIIPYTFQHTNFQYLKPGDHVNVEFDLIGKYIAQQTKKPGR